MAGMKRVLGFLAIIGDCDLLFPLHYGSVIHKSWPDWLAMVVAGLALVQPGYEQVDEHRNSVVRSIYRARRPPVYKRLGGI
jgi:hypothetical protein